MSNQKKDQSSKLNSETESMDKSSAENNKKESDISEDKVTKDKLKAKAKELSLLDNAENSNADSANTNSSNADNKEKKSDNADSDKSYPPKKTDGEDESLIDNKQQKISTHEHDADSSDLKPEKPEKLEEKSEEERDKKDEANDDLSFSLHPDLLANFKAAEKSMATGLLSEEAIAASQKNIFNERLEMKAKAGKKNKADKKTVAAKGSLDSGESSTELAGKNEKNSTEPEGEKSFPPKDSSLRDANKEQAGTSEEESKPVEELKSAVPNSSKKEKNKDKNEDKNKDKIEDKTEDKIEEENFEFSTEDHEEWLGEKIDDEEVDPLADHFENDEGEELEEDEGDDEGDEDDGDGGDNEEYEEDDYADDDEELEEEEEEEEEEEKKAPTLKDHLLELRRRVFWMFLWALIGFAFCYPFAKEIFHFLQQPLQDVLPAGSKFIYTAPSEGFFTELKVAFVAGIFFSSPMIFYQFWRFIAPGLYEEEKKFLVPLAVFSALFFISGAAFCYFISFPVIFKFFMGYSTESVSAMPSLRESLGFILQLLLAFGLVFEMPLVVFFLARLGIVTADMMIRSGRYAIVLIFIVAAVLTPPDIFSQTLMAGPMLLLYGLSIYIAKIFGKKPPKDDDEKDEDDDEKGENKGTNPSAAVAADNESADEKQVEDSDSEHDGADGADNDNSDGSDNNAPAAKKLSGDEKNDPGDQNSNSNNEADDPGDKNSDSNDEADDSDSSDSSDGDTNNEDDDTNGDSDGDDSDSDGSAADKEMPSEDEADRQAAPVAHFPEDNRSYLNEEKAQLEAIKEEIRKDTEKKAAEDSAEEKRKRESSANPKGESDSKDSESEK